MVILFLEITAAYFENQTKSHPLGGQNAKHVVLYCSLLEYLYKHDGSYCTHCVCRFKHNKLSFIDSW